ncbi:hypothetical protein PoB_004387100 [Plakobranchus ocellatus]|uniref:Uncharacterized protein n=1 Tax=Plakobranchus ocellatus TaxID=259542 RepID=A0AAV4B1Y2_9GAST|nr:hypothetical protein PoB_004387100 [Plakobranchus ocellatus]
MKTAIQASLHHCFSTDATLRHDFCPSGPDSWCFFKSAQAKGEPPGPSWIMHCCMSTCSLSTTGCQIMSSCLDAFAMRLNANESLHSVIWSKCSKTKFASAKKVRFSMLLAIAEYNHGPEGSLQLKELYGGTRWVSSARLLQRRTSKRLAASRLFETDKVSRRRTARKIARKRREREMEELEGGLSYALGAF